MSRAQKLLAKRAAQWVSAVEFAWNQPYGTLPLAVLRRSIRRKRRAGKYRARTLGMMAEVYRGALRGLQKRLEEMELRARRVAEIRLTRDEEMG